MIVEIIERAHQDEDQESNKVRRSRSIVAVLLLIVWTENVVKKLRGCMIYKEGLCLGSAVQYHISSSYILRHRQVLGMLLHQYNDYEDHKIIILKIKIKTHLLPIFV